MQEATDTLDRVRPGSGGTTGVSSDRTGRKPRPAWKRALTAVALAASLSVILGGMIVGASRQNAEETAASEQRTVVAARLASSDEYPLAERESLPGCRLRVSTIGSCVLTEEGMRKRGAEPWRLAEMRTRQACLEETMGASEPAARLYLCLKR